MTQAKLGVTIVGSTDTPPAACTHLSWLSFCLAREGLEVRSGHAEGADWAAEQGASQAMDPDCHQLGVKVLPAAIYLPWEGFGRERAVLGRAVVVRSSFAADQLVRDYHPKADKLTAGAFSLMRRNGYQVLGDNLDDPSVAIICWRDPAKSTSGTDQALRIGAAYEVPVFNLALGVGDPKAPSDLDLGVTAKIVLGAVRELAKSRRAAPPSSTPLKPLPLKKVLTLW